MLDPLAIFLGNEFAGRGLTPIPLVSTDHEVDLALGLAVVTTHRLFRNAEEANIEAVLTFPVPVHATLFELAAEVDGRTLRATAKARSEARAVYEDAVTRGKSAVLHEELLKGIHMVSVANIQSGGEIRVTTKWAMPVSVLEGHASLRIPQTVGEVYGRSGLPDADDLLLGGPVQPVSLWVRCPDEVKVVGASLIGGRATVTSGVPIDLIVPLWAPAPLIGYDSSGRAVSLTLTPQTVAECPLDVALLVDHSGSMNGPAGGDGSLTAHEAARQGVTCLADNLCASDSVALWQFDTTASEVGNVVAGQASLGDAKAELKNLAAQLLPPRGGTEIGGAIQAVFRSSEAHDILLLTDGRSHELDVQELARSGRRISVILLGADSLEAKIGHLAALTGGDLFIATADDLADVMAAALVALRRPSTLLPALAQIPDQIVCVRNNVELRASWAHDDAKGAETEFGRAAVAVGASLIVSSVACDVAAQYAEEEGIVSHLTSLVLVDEAGATQEALPSMRKVALTQSVSAMRLSAAPTDTFFDLRASVDMLVESVSLSPPMVEEMGQAREFNAGSPSMRHETHQIARLIDWGNDPERLLEGDISRLAPEVQLFVADLSLKDEIEALSQRFRVPAIVVAIVLLAEIAATEDRFAERAWNAFFNRWEEKINENLDRMLRSLLRDLFAEMDGRLSEIVGEFSQNVAGEIDQALLNVALGEHKRGQNAIYGISREADEQLRHVLEQQVSEARHIFASLCASL